MTADRSSIPENERALIGTLLTDIQRAGDVVSLVSSHEFADQQLGKVYDVILRAASSGCSEKQAIQAVMKSRLLPFSEIADISRSVIDPGFAIWHAEQIRADARKSADGKKSHTSRAVLLFDDYLAGLKSGECDQLYSIPAPLDGFEVGPGLISALGAGPGTGKTALASQLLFGALELNSNLVATIANAEMSFRVLARRELVRRTGLQDKRLRFADLSTSDWIAIDTAANALRPLLERVRWLEPPYRFEQLKLLQNDLPGFLVVDYLQKFSPDGEARAGVNAVMALLRHLALDGWGVLALSATTRTSGKSSSGHDSKSLTLASFKESSEIEFNADSAYLLRDNGPIDGKEWLRSIELSCVKNRHGEMAPKDLEFNKAGMRFRAAGDFANSEWRQGWIDPLQSPEPAVANSGQYDFGDYSENPFDSEDGVYAT
jgi:replicative DNA helicase